MTPRRKRAPVLFAGENGRDGMDLVIKRARVAHPSRRLCEVGDALDVGLAAKGGIAKRVVSSHREAIVARVVTVASPRGAFEGFLAMPNGEAWASATVVIGEHPVVDPHVIDVARRLAIAGHGALAMGYGAQGSLVPASPQVTESALAALARLRAEAPELPTRLGVVGYGLGGFIALVAGYRGPFGAAVSVDGEGPMRLHAELARIIDRPKRHAATFLFLLGSDDASVQPASVAKIRDRLTMFGMKHSFIIYPRMGSGFSRALPLPTESEDAWQRLLHTLENAPRLRNRVPPRARG